MAKDTTNQDLQIELLKAQLENLSAKMSKPQTQEEAFHLRQEQYEAKAEYRELLKKKIEQRRMEIMMRPDLMGKARMDEVILLESWERRAEDLKEKNPHFAAFLKGQFERKLKDIKQDTLR